MNTTKRKSYDIETIRKKLKWFHGEEFDKYPFKENHTSREKH